MAKNADACIVFWDGESSGTKSMIEEAKKHQLPLKIVNMNFKIGEGYAKNCCLIKFEAEVSMNGKPTKLGKELIVGVKGVDPLTQAIAALRVKQEEALAGNNGFYFVDSDVKILEIDGEVYTDEDKSIELEPHITNYEQQREILERPETAEAEQDAPSAE